MHWRSTAGTKFHCVFCQCPDAWAVCSSNETKVSMNFWSSTWVFGFTLCPLSSPSSLQLTCIQVQPLSRHCFCVSHDILKLFLDRNAVCNGLPANESACWVPVLKHSWCTGQDGRYELAEPLMASHQALLRLLDRSDALVVSLEDQAKAARQASRLMHAQSALLQLQLILQKPSSRYCFSCEPGLSGMFLGRLEGSLVLI